MDGMIILKTKPNLMVQNKNFQNSKTKIKTTTNFKGGKSII